MSEIINVRKDHMSAHAKKARRKARDDFIGLAKKNFEQLVQ